MYAMYYIYNQHHTIRYDTNQIRYIHPQNQYTVVRVTKAYSKMACVVECDYCVSNMESVLECKYCVSDNEIVQDENHVSPDAVAPTPKDENLSVEETLLKKLPEEGENEDKKKCWSVSFEETIGPDECASGRWLQVSESVYGFCVLSFVQREVPTDIGDFIDAFLVTFLPCFVIGFVQGYLIYKLLDGTPKLEDTDFCANENTRFLFTCIIGVFLISMEPGMQSIFNELTILRTSKISFLVDQYDGQSWFKKNKGTDILSRSCAILIVLYEFVVWMGVLIAGVKYILSIDPSDIGNVVQASVAIGFIDQIDDMALFLYGELGEKTKTDHFRCNVTMNKIKRSVFETIFTIPILLSCAFGIVYGLHDSYC